jgi:AGZA family xanthine/uracil permease-like MFS transporter
MLAKNGLRAAGVGSPEGPGFSAELVSKFSATDTWIEGAFALEQGFIFSSMLIAAATVEVIERRFARAAVWTLVAAALSAAGLVHSFTYGHGDTELSLAPAWPWAIGYACMGALFLAARYITRPDDAGHG